MSGSGSNPLIGALYGQGGKVYSVNPCCCGGPAPCDCVPDSLAAAYCVHFPAGSVTSGGDTATWDAQSLTVNNIGTCELLSAEGAFAYTLNGTPGSGGFSLELVNPPGGPCGWFVGIPVIPFVTVAWQSSTGTTPDLGTYAAVEPAGFAAPNVTVSVGAC